MDNTNVDYKIEKVLISKVQLLVGLIAFMTPIIGFFWKIQLDISLIKQNHETHIEYAMEQIKELKLEEKEIRIRINTQQEAIIRLLEINGK